MLQFRNNFSRNKSNKAKNVANRRLFKLFAINTMFFENITKIYLKRLTSIFEKQLQYYLKKFTIFCSITNRRLTSINKQ